MNRNPLRSKYFWHFLKDLPAIIGSLLLLVMIIGAVFAPFIAPQNPYDLKQLNLGDSLKPPIWMEGGKAPFLLGTDDQGRGIFSTILYGSRTSFIVGFSVIAIAGTVGTLLGLLAAFYGGILDALLMRTADTLFSFSNTLVAILLLGIFQEGGLMLVIIAIVVTDWVKYARTIRGSVLGVKEEDYVSAAAAVGNKNWRILARHIVPNAIPPIFVVAAVDFGAVVVLEATLSFLGVGVPINQPSLGMLISIGRDYLYVGNWWLTIFPGVALVAIVLGINLLADWLREEINPRIQRS